MRNFSACLSLILLMFFSSCSVEDPKVVNNESTDSATDDETSDETETTEGKSEVTPDENQPAPDNNQVVDNETADTAIDNSEPVDEDEVIENDETQGNDEDPDLDNITDTSFVNEDFEDEDTWKMWKTVNINLLMNSADPFVYTGDMWEIGVPASTGKVETAFSGTNVLATILDNTIPDNKNLMNVIYYNKKFTIPPEGIDIELYAFVDTHAYPNDTKRGGVLLYLCEEVNFLSGGKCSKVGGDAANTVELVTDLASTPSGFINSFYGLYTSEYLGIAGKTTDYVKITGSVKSDTSSGKNVYLVIEYAAPNDSGTNVYGIYIDDIKVEKKDQ